MNTETTQSLLMANLLWIMMGLLCTFYIAKYGWAQLVKLIPSPAWDLPDPNPGATAKPKKRKPKTKKAHGSLLRTVDEVDFDPADPQHLVALAMLMDQGRLHPTLRFKYDASLYDNAYAAALLSLANYHIPEHLHREAARMSKAKVKTRKRVKPGIPEQTHLDAERPHAAPLALHRGQKRTN